MVQKITLQDIEVLKAKVQDSKKELESRQTRRQQWVDTHNKDLELIDRAIFISINKINHAQGRIEVLEAALKDG